MGYALVAEVREVLFEEDVGPGGAEELREVNVRDAGVAALAVGAEVGLAAVQVQEVVELLGHHRAPVLVAHLRRRTLQQDHPPLIDRTNMGYNKFVPLLLIGSTRTGLPRPE